MKKGFLLLSVLLITNSVFACGQWHHDDLTYDSAYSEMVTMEKIDAAIKIFSSWTSPMIQIRAVEEITSHVDDKTKKSTQEDVGFKLVHAAGALLAMTIFFLSLLIRRFIFYWGKTKNAFRAKQKPFSG